MGYEMSKEYAFLGRLTIAYIAGRCSHYVAQRAWRTDRDSKELDGIMEVIIDNILIFTYEFGFYNHCYTSRNALGFIEKKYFPQITISSISYVVPSQKGKNPLLIH